MQIFMNIINIFLESVFYKRNHTMTLLMVIIDYLIMMKFKYISIEY
jgi:hypothetical protein